MSVHPGFDPEALSRMGHVIEWHTQRGARFISLPWMTARVDAEATKPNGHGADITTSQGILVASGEQSFTRLAREGLLDGAPLHIGWTPCFRNEPVFDDTHHYYFIKAELFSWIDESSDAWQQAEDLALRASGALGQWAHATIVGGVDEIDLVVGGLEVGSAGVRCVPGDGRRYAYCTALAEPRFGRALRETQERG